MSSNIQLRVQGLGSRVQGNIIPMQSLTTPKDPKSYTRARLGLHIHMFWYTSFYVGFGDILPIVENKMEGTCKMKWKLGGRGDSRCSG